MRLLRICTIGLAVTLPATAFVFVPYKGREASQCAAVLPANAALIGVAADGAGTLLVADSKGLTALAQRDGSIAWRFEVPAGSSLAEPPLAIAGKAVVALRRDGAPEVELLGLGILAPNEGRPRELWRRPLPDLVPGGLGAPTRPGEPTSPGVVAVLSGERLLLLDAADGHELAVLRSGPVQGRPCFVADSLFVALTEPPAVAGVDLLAPLANQPALQRSWPLPTGTIIQSIEWLAAPQLVLAHTADGVRFFR